MSEEAPLFDLSTLDFRPSWAKEEASPRPAAPASSHAGQPVPPRPREGENRGRRDDRRGPPPRRDKPFGRDRRDGPVFRKGPRDDRRGPQREEHPAPPANPFPWLRIAFTATGPAVETVVQQVRHTGKTFSLFDIARILLRNPASYILELSSAPKPPEGPFYVAGADGSVWLSCEAAARHLLRTKLDQFYRAETVDVEPPKGNFSVIAVCGMSGTLLGPPNLHDYERRVRELHRQKFGRMDFEQFRSRLRMERNPEVIEKWRGSVSKAVEYYPLEGEDAGKLEGMAAVEKHFIGHHASAQIQTVATCAVPGDPRAAVVDPALAPLLAYARDEEARFPLRLAQSLSRALSGAGLRFHKSANRTTWVSASRPRHLDLTQVVVSDSIQKILGTIREKKSIRRMQLLGILAPLPAKSAAQKEPASAAAEAAAPAETASAAAEVVAPTCDTPAVAGIAPAAGSAASEQISPAAPETTPVPEAAVPAVPEVPAGPSPQPLPPPKTPEEAARQAIVEDILWLTHEGYVIEYADGRLESVPPPKHPPKSGGEEPAGSQGPQEQQPEA